MVRGNGQREWSEGIVRGSVLVTSNLPIKTLGARQWPTNIHRERGLGEAGGDERGHNYDC